MATNFKTNESMSLELSACIDKFMSVLLQFHRLTMHHDDFIKQAKAAKPQFKNQAGGSMAIRGAEAIYDFESFLIQSRACIDRLTYFLCENKTDKPRALINILKTNKWQEYKPALTFVERSFADKIVQALLINERKGNNERSLRSFIVHRAAGMEVLDNCFEVYFLSDDSVLLFDCVLNDKYSGFSVFASAEQIMKHITYLVLNILSVYAKINTSNDVENQILWKNQSISWKDFVADDTSTLSIGLVKMHPDGFFYDVKELDRNIVSHAIQL